MKKRNIILCILSAIILFSVCVSNTSAEENKVYKKKISLTFDDGPHPKYTREVLDILDSYNIKATFFIIGSNAELYPELVKEEMQKGHEIGNHTYNHPNMKKISYEELAKEIKKNEEVLFNLTGKVPTLFRPPCGEISNSVSSIIKDKEYRMVLWSIDTRDWAHTSKEKIVENVKKNAKSGAIILMHDYINGENHSPEALKVIIEYLLSEGYEFVTVSELYKN